MAFLIQYAIYKTGRLLVSGRFFVLALSLISVLLISCAYHGEVKVKFLSDGELLIEKKAIFLFRLSIGIDNDSIDLYKEFNQNNIQIFIANIDSEGLFERVPKVYSPSVEMSKKGWFYFLLDPAVYYMKISTLWQPKLNPVLFYIPNSSRFVYGGSFSVSCNGGLSAGFQCNDIQISNEIKNAELIGEHDLKVQSPVETFIAESITDSLPDSIKNELMPIAILT